MQLKGPVRTPQGPQPAIPQRPASLGSHTQKNSNAPDGDEPRGPAQLPAQLAGKLPPPNEHLLSPLSGPVSLALPWTSGPSRLNSPGAWNSGGIAIVTSQCPPHCSAAVGAPQLIS